MWERWRSKDVTGAQQEMDESRVVRQNWPGWVEVEQERQRRSRGKLWAGGQQSEIANPARETAISYIHMCMQGVLSSINHQSNPFSYLSHFMPFNRVVLDIHGFHAEVVKVKSSR